MTIDNLVSNLMWSREKITVLCFRLIASLMKKNKTQKRKYATPCPQEGTLAFNIPSLLEHHGSQE